MMQVEAGSTAGDSEGLPNADRPEATWPATRAGGVGATSRLDADQRARLLAIACGDPPVGWTKWTLPRLAVELVRREIVPRIAPEEVREALIEVVLRGEHRV